MKLRELAELPRATQGDDQDLHEPLVLRGAPRLPLVVYVGSLPVVSRA